MKKKIAISLMLIAVFVIVFNGLITRHAANVCMKDDTKVYDLQKAAYAYEQNILDVYLVNSLLARMPNKDIKMVYRVRVYAHNYKIVNDVLYATPIQQNIFGKEIIIPLYNIRSIIKGKNRCKKHLIEKEKF